MAEQSKTVDLPTGLRYHYLQWGQPQDHAHTVILLHGFLDCSWGWHATVSGGLEGRFHLLAPDMRGHGDSDRIGQGGYYHFLDYVADLAHFIEGVQTCDSLSIVGHSMGGSIASYFAGSFPDSIHRLALLEGLGPPEDRAAMPKRVAEWTSNWPKAKQRVSKTYESINAAAQRLMAHDAMLGEDLALWLAQKTTHHDSNGYSFKHDPLHLTRGPVPFAVDMAALFWERITCPTLFVDGSESVFQGAAKESARRRAFFRNGSRATLNGAGHMLQRHKPVQLAAILQQFLQAP